MQTPLATSTVSNQYQTTLPSKVRKMLGLEKQDILSYDIIGRNVVIRKKESLKDSLKRIRSYNDPVFVRKYAGKTAAEIRDDLMRSPSGHKETEEKYGF
jgi:bifunctional DNA-binding transcriptional regulator/antitoxin component of YhaV-PrlF toxin-antitoxin module